MQGHHAESSAASLDSQSVKSGTPAAIEVGFDGGKIIKGRLRPLVDRTSGWLNWSRRLFKDYEVLPETSETFVYVAMIRLMLKRLGIPSLLRHPLRGRD